jgi:tetratricopeptide (TPR) repeat protein
VSVLFAARVVGLALFIRPPLDYREEQIGRVIAQLEALGADGRMLELIDLGTSFEADFEPSVDVAYEVGLAANRLGRSDEALYHYRRAIEMDPNHAAARYDRGELLLARGDLDGAKADFEVAAEMVPDHWVVHFRLAHIAAVELRTLAVETHLDQAVAHGMSFEVLLADHEWRAWVKHAQLGPVLKRIILRYSTEETWKKMGAEP